MNKQTWIPIALIVLLAIPAGLSAQHQDQLAAVHQPTIVEFEVPHAGRGAFQGTYPLGNNNQGAITGYWIARNGLYHGFLRAPDGTITSFDPPGAGTLEGSGQGTYPISINGRSDIVGQYQDENNLFHGFLRAADGTFTTIDAPGAGTRANQGTVAANIRWDGLIVGYYIDEHDAFHGFIRVPDGSITSFDAPDAGTHKYQGTVVSTTEHDINADGEISGWYFDSTGMQHGYLRSPDDIFTTIDGPGAAGSLLAGVTSNREGGGYYYDATYKGYGFLFADGAMTTFQDPAAGLGPGEGTFVFDMNFQGVITGQYTDTTYANYGYVRRASGKFINFAAPHASGGNVNTIYTGTWPKAINYSNQVTGYYYDKNYVGHGFVWTP